ncbi:MAG: hypothetical protein ACPG8W_19655 [Candidatus Promineifilaceae bacterium]
MKRFEKTSVVATMLLAIMLTLLVSTASAMNTGAHTTTRWTNVWSAPNNGQQVGVLAPNTSVNVVGYSANNRWAQITASSLNGWVPANALAASAGGGNAGGGGCVIPPSGPWPPCATNGNTPSSGNSGGGCVIPPSGPWPSCATGGGAAPETNSTNNNNNNANTALPGMTENRIGPNAEPERFNETVVAPFEVEPFRRFIGRFRDSLRGFTQQLSSEDETLSCHEYKNWLKLWVVESHVYTHVPPEYDRAHKLWRAMLTDIVNLTHEIRNFCDGEPGVGEIDVRAIAEWLIVYYPVSEDLVDEVFSLPDLERTP